MTNKRILVVDDDPDLLFLVAHGVKSIAPGYQVTTAADGRAALDQAQKQKFHLVISDYMMPEMTGLELIKNVSKISADTRFILMTAHHDTTRMRAEIETVNLSGFVSKPFTVPGLLSVVQKVLSSVDEEEAQVTEAAAPQKNTIRNHLQNLGRQTGAHSVVLVRSDGTPVYAAGSSDKARIARLATFVSANFLAIAELASLFGDNESVFKSSYYEGNKYNLYAHDINGSFFLAVVVGAQSKPGTVWFYAKQVAAALVPLLTAPDTVPARKTDTGISQDFDKLVGHE